MEKRQLTGMGASSVLLIFVVLCLTTFGILTLVTAQADLRLSYKARESLQIYYTADSKTDIALKDIDFVLAKARTNEEYKKNLNEKLSGIDYVSFAGDDSVTILVPMLDEQYLQTVISVLPLQEPLRYKIETRQVISQSEWEEETFNFWIPPDD